MGDSALVLHWQGTNSDLKPVLIGNDHGVSRPRCLSWFICIDRQRPLAVLDVTGVIPAPGLSSPGSDVPEHIEELMDLQSGVGLLWVVSFTYLVSVP